MNCIIYICGVILKFRSMKTNRYLLPNYFRIIGWIISIPSAIVLLPCMLMDPYDADPAVPGIPTAFLQESWWNIYSFFNGGNLFASVCMVLLMIGLLFIAFSKEKIEDEFIAKLRGDSLIWAVIVNSVLLLVCSLFIYGGWFLYVSFFNLYTLLVLFIIKYRIALFHFKKEVYNEE